MSFSDGTTNVLAGLVSVGTTAASTATLTVYINGVPFVLPELDLSSSTNQVPFTLPITIIGAINITYDVAVTGASGTYGIVMTA